MGFLKFLFVHKLDSKTRKLPNGLTETKISEDTYVTNISQEQLDN